MTQSYTAKDVEVPKKLKSIAKAIFGGETDYVFQNSLHTMACYNKSSPNTFVGQATLQCLVDDCSHLIFELNFDTQGQLDGESKIYYFVYFLGQAKMMKSVTFNHTSVSDVLDQYRRHQLKQQKIKTKEMQTQNQTQNQNQS
jgi:hypothetical protein